MGGSRFEVKSYRFKAQGKRLQVANLLSQFKGAKTEVECLFFDVNCNL